MCRQAHGPNFELRDETPSVRDMASTTAAVLGEFRFMPLISQVLEAIDAPDDNEKQIAALVCDDLSRISCASPPEFTQLASQAAQLKEKFDKCYALLDSLPGAPSDE